MKKLLSTVIIIALLLQISMATGDVPSDWAKPTINQVFEQTLLDSRMQGDYQTKISRKDFAYLGVLLYEKLTDKKTVVGEASFLDTKDNYVLRAKNTGIVNGYPSGEYKPNKPISRQELAKLFINALRAAKVDLKIKISEQFKDDSKIQPWAKDEVYIAKALGVVNGVGNNTFNPEGTATREQAIVMFTRVLNHYGITKINESADNTAETNANQAIDVPVGSLKTGSDAPDFSVDSFFGRSLKWQTLKGKSTVLYFFTTWCPPCLEQLPIMEKTSRNYGKDVSIIAINLAYQDDRNALRQVIEKYALSYDIGLDDGEMQVDYYVSSLPMTFFIDKNGKVVESVIGVISESYLNSTIDKIMK